MPSCFKNLVQRSQSYHNFTKKKIIITKKNLKLNLAEISFEMKQIRLKRYRIRQKLWWEIKGTFEGRHPLSRTRESRFGP